MRGYGKTEFIGRVDKILIDFSGNRKIEIDGKEVDLSKLRELELKVNCDGITVTFTSVIPEILTLICKNNEVYK